MVVFDFDKTLINKDTLFGFYRAVDHQNAFFDIKRLLLISFAIFYKLGLISNTQLKRVGIALFLKGKSREQIDAIGEKYAQELRLNSIYEDYYLSSSKDQRIVITASLGSYIRPLFEDNLVLCSELKYENNLVIGLDFNCYSENKPNAYFEEVGKLTIDELYTDSTVDLPLIKISKYTYVVMNGRVIRTIQND